MILRHTRDIQSLKGSKQADIHGSLFPVKEDHGQLTWSAGVMARAIFLVACIFMAVLGVYAQSIQQPETNDSDLAKRVAALEQGQQQMLQELKLLEAKVGPAATGIPTSFKIQSEPSIGERSAPVAIVEFADFECPYCGQFERDTYPQVLENCVKTGKAAFFFHDVPLSAHAHALDAAIAARCAGEQGKYWEMHDDLFAHQSELARTILADGEKWGMDAAKFHECVSSGRYTAAIQKSAQDAEQLGVRATPSFLIGTLDADGHELKVMRALRGAYTYEAFKAVLDGVLVTCPQIPRR